MLPIITAFFLLASGQVQAQEPTGTPTTIKVPVPKSGLNTDLFEKDEEDPVAAADAKIKNLNAKVKVVREESDGVEVFFEGEKNTGAYFLHRAIPHYAKALKALEDSRKPLGPPVSISFTEDKKIKSVELKKNSFKEVPTDPNEKWDFSKVPGN